MGPPLFGKTSGCGAAWLAHLLWEQRVGGSNPLAPTKHWGFVELSTNPFFVRGDLPQIEALEPRYNVPLNLGKSCT